jgi:ATP-dependent exoDNAse (exonuclease V) beta subunit
MLRYGYALKPPTQYHNMFEFVEGLLEAFEFNLNNNPFLQFFLEQVHLFEKNQSSSIRDFMDWYFERGHESSIISPEGANAVQVMTIHKSKGLQFPVVICPFVDWKMDLHKQIAWIDNPDALLPAFFIKMNKELADTKLSAIYLSESGKFLLDQINLLYVAFTRPEVALFMCGKANKASSPAKEWLVPYFQQTTLGKLEGERFTFGELKHHQKGKKLNVTNYPVAFTTKRMEKPVLSYKSAENWDIHELDEKRLFGTKLHHILSKIDSLNALDMALSKAFKKGHIDSDDSHLLKEKITELFKDEGFRFYFEQESQLNERAIITRDGNRFIPDKIIYLKDKLLIVDFKTGQSSPSHKKQLLNYMQIMQDMGYSNVIGELYYTENREIVCVN